MFYVCRSGFQVPVACSTIDGVRVEPNANYQTSTFLFQCQQPHSQVYQLIASACIRNGQIIQIGSTAADDNFWYTCTRGGEQIQLKISGCVGEQGSRVGPGGIITRTDFLFRCAFNGNSVALEPYGCVVDGSHYPAGQDIIAQNFWYQCHILPSGNGLERKLAGCMENGQKLVNGSTVVKNGFFFQCDISGDRARFAAVGCLDDKGGHHLIGESWRDEQGHGIYYVTECKREETKIFKQVKQCYYQGGTNGEGVLEPNCVKKFGNVLVKCIQREAGGRISAEVHQNVRDEDVRNAINAGFRQC